MSECWGGVNPQGQSYGPKFGPDRSRGCGHFGGGEHKHDENAEPYTGIPESCPDGAWCWWQPAKAQLSGVMAIKKKAPPSAATILGHRDWEEEAKPCEPQVPIPGPLDGKEPRGLVDLLRDVWKYLTGR